MLYLPGEFPQEAELMYLNHAAAGPWPRRTAQAVSTFAQVSMTRGASDYPQWLETENRLRERIRRLINAPAAEDIALVQNTSEGLSIISQGLDWRDGDEVIGVEGDFCSNQMPWQALAERGVRYRAIDVLGTPDPEGTLIAALSPNTRLLAISTVHFANGYRFDVERLSRTCRERDVLLSVDAIQSLGARRFDLKAVDADFVTSGSHKWLLAPEGIGFLYCRPTLRDRLSLHRFGWAMRAEPYAFEVGTWTAAATARRFEAGSPNMLGIHALDASLSLFEEVGFDTVEQRLAGNVANLEAAIDAIPGTEVVTPRDPRQRAGILTFRVDGVDGQALHAALMRAHLICSPRAGGVRLSPHFYTPTAVLERAAATIADAIAAPR